MKNEHHDNSSYHLSPFKVITILLTLFPMLYTSSSWHLFFDWKSVPLTYFTHPSIPFPLVMICLFSLYLSLFLFCCVHSFVHFFSAPYISEVIQYLSFSIRLTSLTLSQTMLLQMARFHSFLQLSNIPLRVYPSLSIHLSMDT